MSIQLLLKDRIKDLSTNYPNVQGDELNEFELSVADIFNIKYFNGLDFDDLTQGIVGGGGDEGVDICYLFINDQLVKEFEPDDINKSSIVRLEIIQSKGSGGFSTNGFKNLCEGIEEIFTLDNVILKKIGANESLLKKAYLIREVFKETMQKGGAFKARAHYVTTGDTKNIDEKIRHLEDSTKTRLSWVKNLNFEFWGAQV